MWKYFWWWNFSIQRRTLLYPIEEGFTFQLRKTKWINKRIWFKRNEGKSFHTFAISCGILCVRMLNSYSLKCELLTSQCISLQFFSLPIFFDYNRRRILFTYNTNSIISILKVFRKYVLQKISNSYLIKFLECLWNNIIHPHKKASQMEWDIKYWN